VRATRRQRGVLLIALGAAGGLGYGLYARGVLEIIEPGQEPSASALLVQLAFDPHLVVYWLLPVWLLSTVTAAATRMRLAALTRHGSRLRALHRSTGMALVEAGALLAGCAMGALLAASGLPWSQAIPDGSISVRAWLISEVPVPAALIAGTVVQYAAGLAAIASALVAWAAMPERRRPGLLLSAVAVWIWSAIALLAGGPAGGLPSPLSLLPGQVSNTPWLLLCLAFGGSAAVHLAASALVARADERR
jgi:hypothetical protein